MKGYLFARNLKQNPELRHDFEEFLKDQRGYASAQLEGTASEIGIFHAQGKIQALDGVKNALADMMNLTPETNDVSRHS